MCDWKVGVSRDFAAIAGPCVRVLSQPREVGELGLHHHWREPSAALRGQAGHSTKRHGSVPRLATYHKFCRCRHWGLVSETTNVSIWGTSR